MNQRRPGAPALPDQIHGDPMSAMGGAPQRTAVPATTRPGVPAPAAPTRVVQPNTTRAAMPAPAAPQTLVGTAPPWLKAQSATSPGGNVTLTNVDYEGLPAIDTDFSGQAQKGAEAAYKGATQFFDEDFGRDRAAMETKLINQGFAPGSEAFKNEMGMMLRGQNAARENAAFMAQGVGHQQSGDLLLRALQSRGAMLGERTDMADRLFNQSFGVAGLGTQYKQAQLGAQASKAAASASAAASQYASDAANRRAELEAALGMRRLELDESGQNFSQMVGLTGLSRGGVNAPNFGPPQPLDVGGAYGIASANNNAQMNRDASDRAGLYGLGGAALGALGSYYGGYG